MTFTRFAMLAGVLLILVTIYALAADSTVFFTALLPAVAGVLTIAICALAERSGALRGQTMIGVGVIAGLTLVGSLRLLFVLNDPNESQASLIAHAAALIISAALLAAAVRALVRDRQRSTS